MAPSRHVALQLTGTCQVLTAANSDSAQLPFANVRARPGCAAGRRFALGLCSLNGHQLAGEERFQVELHADGSVW